MEVKSLFEEDVKQEIITRINMLRPASQRKWGKMDVAQMLAHTQQPLKVALGEQNCKGNFLIRTLSVFFKSNLYNDKPFAKNLPTDKTFKIADTRDFQKERENLVSMISVFSPERLTERPHPVFGPLTQEQWSKSQWKHLDHHLQQFGV
jgi:hypothetical protein